jgi:hypothetical protein
MMTGRVSMGLSAGMAVVMAGFLGCGFATTESGPGALPKDVVEVVAAPDVPPEAVAELPPGDPGSGPWQVQGPADWSTNSGLKPRAVHVTWQGDPAHTVTIQWQTDTAASDGYVPKVWIVPAAEAGEGPDGTMPFQDARVFTGTGFTYQAFDDVSPDGLVDRSQWTVEVTGLDPKTAYRYRAGTWSAFDKAAATFATPDLSPVQDVRTGREPGDRSAFRFVSAGDSRTGSDKIRENAPRLAQVDADFWLFNGDMTEVGSQPEWDEWLDAMSPILATSPLMPIQGNHEVFADLFYYQFAMPQIGTLPDDMKEHGWSFTYGNMHFVGLDSNTEASVVAQKDWLDADLAEASIDPDIDWVVAMFHHPAYSASPSHGSTQRVIDNWVPIFEKHGVALAFAGHDHDYERSFPIRASQKVEDGQGPVYVVVGGFYSPGYSAGQDWWTFVSHHGDKGNYAVVDVDGKNLTVTAYAGYGDEILDTFTLSK